MGRVRFVVGGFIIAVGIGFLIFSGLHHTASRRITVRQLAEFPRSPLSSERLQVGGGTVLAGSIVWDEYRTHPTFTVMQGKQRLRVRYVGRSMLADTFQGGAQVVLEGRWDAAAGIFRADKVYAKCPSKYAGKGYAGHVRAHAGD